MKNIEEGEGGVLFLVQIRNDFLCEVIRRHPAEKGNSFKLENRQGILSRNI